jgi:hypothetical protein
MKTSRAIASAVAAVLAITLSVVFAPRAAAVLSPGGGSTGCKVASSETLLGCFWADSYFRSYNLTLYNPNSNSSKGVFKCVHDNFAVKPSGWNDRISSMSNWSTYSHYYFTDAGRRGTRYTLGAGKSVATLTSAYDNKFSSIELTCYVKK